SVYLIWKIGREWFSPTVGLLAAATIAFMQYPIMHSQMALPYASGLFFTLLMLLGWSRIVLMRTHNYRYNFILFVAGGILCSYNHYFTLLMVILAVFSGFFFVKGKDLKKYIAGCLLILAAFIPHIPISLHQLKMAEANQISFSCNADYLVGFAKYILNFSWIVACALAAVVLFGLISSIVRKKLHFSKFHAVTLIFCFIPLLSAFLLSGNFSLLHQYSVLLFSFPLLIVFAFSLYEKLSMRHTIGIMIVWSLILIHSLFWSRDHYRYFYHSQFEETTKEIKAFTQTHPV
ncbi:MAG TPA: glycosyltransferase family 39 protein, partial [Bacteroidales bacterium]|nr:glycosyltransferase family 39 protein [Bacteroidales bacterium]